MYYIVLRKCQWMSINMARDMHVKDLILGTMKSAKSAQLIMRGYLLDSQGKKVITFKPDTDTRDSNNVVSRALPIKRPAILVSKEDNGESMVIKVQNEKPDTILIDELQFFTLEQIDKIAEISRLFQVDIYAYGLMIAYNGEMFDSIKRAIECGFRIHTLDMSCDHCHNIATHHLLYLDDKVVARGEAIQVEDFQDKSQRFESVCYNCYFARVERELK